MDERIADAHARLATIAEAEARNELLARESVTRAWVPDEPAPVSVVLLHGLTNAPPQYAVLAPQLAALGAAVIVPRLPYHGYADRMTDAIAQLQATDLQIAALEAVAIAALCGERVVVAGISIGAALAGWIASRTAIDTAVAISAFCGLRVLPGGTNDGFGSLLRRLPNAFCWWDPLTKQAQPPPHGYPRFATHALGQSLAVSTAIPRTASAAAARRAIVVCNRNEPVVNNAFALRRFATLEARGTTVEHVELEGLPDIHDIIEPEIPQARIDLVYPRLIELIMTA